MIYFSSMPSSASICPVKAVELKANLTRMGFDLYHPGIPQGPVQREKRWLSITLQNEDLSLTG